MSDTKTITLDRPLPRGDEQITSVDLTKPDTGRLRGLALPAIIGMEVDTMEKLLPRITTPTLTPADIRALDPADLMQLATETAGFFVARRYLEPGQTPAG